MLTADCPVWVNHRIRRRRRLATFAASLAGLLGFGGCSKFDDGPGASTANPPAKQEKSSEKDPGEKELKEGSCIMGKVNMRDFQGPARVGQDPESLPAPRRGKDRLNSANAFWKRPISAFGETPCGLALRLWSRLC